MYLVYLTNIYGFSTNTKQGQRYRGQEGLKPPTLIVRGLSTQKIEIWPNFSYKL